MSEADIDQKIIRKINEGIPRTYSNEPAAHSKKNF